MKTNDSLSEVYESLSARNLGEALVGMEAYVSTRSGKKAAAQVESIRADLDRMTDYWKRGFKDPQLEALYDNLLRRLYVITANAELNYAVGKSTYLSSVYTRLTLTARDWSVQGLREALEGYVSELAMVELEPENKRLEKRKDISRRHHQMMSEWFDYVWLSTMWTDGQAEAMEALLLSPTVDSNDQQLLVSGIMIATIEHFDVGKFRTLLHVYQRSTDEHVRQRALVGWVLALHGSLPKNLFASAMKEVEGLLEDAAVCEELVQLQQQIVFCINAEKDNQTIQREIMPDLLKNSNFRVTRNGIEEVEDDALEDILHPDAEDRRIEQTEESFQKMQAMQKQGSDVYFGGFSQMKRFPFFSEICNWFVPFYMDHPGVSDVVERFGQNRFLQGMMNAGPFCNSDKYSFLIAFSQVMDHIPQQLRAMMERGEATVNEVLQEESRSAAYIRRTYLQDLYRFYKIYAHRREFFNPFEHDDDEDHCWLFFSHPVFSKTHLEPRFVDIAAFLIKRNMPYEAGEVMENVGAPRRDFRFYMTAGYLAQHKLYTFEEDMENEDADLCFYQKAVELQPEHERALLGYARALFGQERYEDALKAYDRLLAIEPEKRTYLLNRAVCLSKLGRNADALKDLYRLNYERPDDENVNRVMAWVLACNGKYEQAEKLYSKLLSVKKPEPKDLLNYGYCLWFAGHVDEASDCFHRYLECEDYDMPEDIISNESNLLDEKGISEAERQMMIYILGTSD